MHSLSSILIPLCLLAAMAVDGRGLVNRQQDENTIVMTMIVRDEAVNIKSNLHLWLGIVDFFVFLVDRRTTDHSEEAIASILDSKEVPYEIVHHDFDGFGSSRTRSLQNAWKYFPQAIFVWIADPDWRPDVSTIQKSSLTRDFDAFRFTIIDRSGITTRQCDWLLLHREGLAMRYHLHEVLDIGMYTPAGVDWVVHEVEQPGSWHTTVGHANSFDAKRSLFDLDLLYKDLAQYGHDPHTHKYLGVTHLAYVNDLVITRTPEGTEVVNFSADTMTTEIADHFQKGNYYCALRVNPNTIYDSEFREERWECMLQMALTASVLGYMGDAEKWYLACYEFNPSEPRCLYSLTALLDQTNNVDKAFHHLQTLLTMKVVARQGINFRAMGTCLVPKLAIPVLLKYANENEEYPVTAGFVQYLHLLLSMTINPECEGFIRPADMSPIRDIVEAMSSLMGINPLPRPTLCADRDLWTFINEKGYSLHNCADT